MSTFQIISSVLWSNFVQLIYVEVLDIWRGAVHNCWLCGRLLCAELYTVHSGATYHCKCEV